MPIEQDITQLVQAADNLTTTVDNKIQAIDTRVDTAEQQLDGFIANARFDYPFVRLTKNQASLTSLGFLDDYTVSSAFPITFTEYRQIIHGTPWAERDAEEQEILSAMGKAGMQYFHPNGSPHIRVVKMTWSGWSAGMNGLTFYQYVPFASNSTCACYAKLISGGIDSFGFSGITNEWGLCGTHFNIGPIGYTHTHPYVNTPSGEVLFTWYAFVSGHVPLDRAKPKWGFYPYVDPITLI